MAPNLVEMYVAQRADDAMFGKGQRMVCIAHAAQHVAAQAALACVVREHDLNAAAACGTSEKRSSSEKSSSSEKPSSQVR